MSKHRRLVIGLAMTVVGEYFEADRRPSRTKSGGSVSRLMGVNMTATLVPGKLRDAIEQAILDSAAGFGGLVGDNLEVVARPRARQLPLALKYVPSDYAADYRVSNSGLYIGTNNYTWGRGVYATGVNEPLSTAIYGRAGVVSRFDPTGWRAFDARVPTNEKLYLRWLQAQPVYRDAVLTVHSGLWLNDLRNHFREQFHIDVVLFRPDERDAHAWYTQTSDTWLTVSDWTASGTLDTEYSTRFTDSRLTVLIEEDFKEDDPALTRSPQFALSGGSPASPALSNLVRHAYAGNTLIRVAS